MKYLSRLSDEEIEQRLRELDQEIYDLEEKLGLLQIEEADLMNEQDRRLEG